jgi:hypothetical protein
MSRKTQDPLIVAGVGFVTGIIVYFLISSVTGQKLSALSAVTVGFGVALMQVVRE